MLYYLSHFREVFRLLRVMRFVSRAMEKQYGTGEVAFRNVLHLRGLIVEQFRGIDPNLQFFALYVLVQSMVETCIEGADGESSATP